MRSQAVEASDELFGGLSLVLCSPVEPYSFKDNVLSDLEELVHLAEELRIPSSVGFTYVSRCEDVFCFLAEVE